MALHGAAKDRHIVFVQDFIRLDVERPVALTVAERDVGLLRINQAVLAQRFVPDRLDDVDLGMRDRPDELQRPVIAPTDVHNEFVAERQGGPNGLHHRIIVFHRIAAKSKPADLHNSFLLFVWFVSFVL